MKKRIAILVLGLLIAGSFTGCGLIEDIFGGADISAYNALVQEMSDLTEYRFTGDVSLYLGDVFLDEDTEFLFEDLMPMQFTVDGSVSHANREMQATYQYQTADGTPMFDVSMIATDNAMYVGLVSMLDYMLRPAFEDLGVDLSDFSMQDLLSGSDYLIIPFEGTLDDMMFAPVQVGATLDLAPFLTREGDRFTITVHGEDIRAMSDEMGVMLEQFMLDSSLSGGEGIGNILGDVASTLNETDLTDASMIIITSRSGEAFFQTFEMNVPGLIEMSANFTFAPAEVAPVGTPENAVTETEFEALMMAIDFDAIFGGQGAPGFGNLNDGNVEIVYDLSALTLIHNELEEGSLLALAGLPNGRGEEHNVPIIAAGNISPGLIHLFNDIDAIELYYVFLDDFNAVDAILMAVEADLSGYFLPDSTLNASVLRTNEARDIAAMAIAEEMAGGMTRIAAYLAQSVPDSNDVIRLEIVLYLDLFGDEESPILAQLSAQFGIDLSAYITQLVG